MRESAAARIEGSVTQRKLAARRASKLPTGPRLLVLTFCGASEARFFAGIRAALERERRYGHALLRPRVASHVPQEEVRTRRELCRRAAALAAQERQQEEHAEERAETSRVAKLLRGRGPAAELLSDPPSAADTSEDELQRFADAWLAT